MKASLFSFFFFFLQKEDILSKYNEYWISSTPTHYQLLILAIDCILITDWYKSLYSNAQGLHKFVTSIYAPYFSYYQRLKGKLIWLKCCSPGHCSQDWERGIYLTMPTVSLRPEPQKLSFQTSINTVLCAHEHYPGCASMSNFG